jgi:hypothetical protein
MSATIYTTTTKSGRSWASPCWTLGVGTTGQVVCARAQLQWSTMVRSGAYVIGATSVCYKKTPSDLFAGNISWWRLKDMSSLLWRHPFCLRYPLRQHASNYQTTAGCSHGNIGFDGISQVWRWPSMSSYTGMVARRHSICTWLNPMAWAPMSSPRLQCWDQYSSASEKCVCSRWYPCVIIIWPSRLNWSLITHRIWSDLVFSAACWQTAWSVPAIYRAPLSATIIHSNLTRFLPIWRISVALCM